MNIIAVNAGIGASVCLFQQKKVVFAIEEERLSGTKGFMGFPRLALEYLCQHYPAEVKSLDAIGLVGLRDTQFSREQYLKRYEERANADMKKSPAALCLHACKALAGRILPARQAATQQQQTGTEERIRETLRTYGFECPRIIRKDHHECHAYACSVLAPDPDRPYLIMTLDGGGDGLCATVSAFREGRLERLSSTPTGHSIGNIYSIVTHLLGFTPHEHEYKLMGMAPYVPEKHARPVLDIFSRYLALDPADPYAFRRLTPESTTMLAVRLARDLKRIRFDSIAAGLQLFTENLVTAWLRSSVKKSGIPDVLLGGGVFMNVKLNQRISLMPEIRSVDIFPSCGDESNSLGCAYGIFRELAGSAPRFETYCLGPTAGGSLEQARAQFGALCDFERLDDPETRAAQLLGQGKILARCSGPMEFGARALGNRSILADPIDPSVVERVNFMIKHRDFWMPFAPAVRAEDAADFLLMPETMGRIGKNCMMFSFDTTPERTKMAACLHKADGTARAQIVDAERYPAFHKLLTHFKELTGRGAIMNTSFNIHGFPIVLDAVQAVKVLLETQLDHVIVEDWLVTRKGK